MKTHDKSDSRFVIVQFRLSLVWLQTELDFLSVMLPLLIIYSIKIQNKGRSLFAAGGGSQFSVAYPPLFILCWQQTFLPPLVELLFSTFVTVW